MFKVRRYQLLLGAAAMTVTACATSTPYTPATQAQGYGFSDQRIENDRYRITFRGNAATPREQVENFLLLRAAELTLAEGFDYFIVVEDETEKTTNYTGMANPALGAFGYGYGPYAFYGPRAFPYYGWGGWGAGGFGSNIDVRERNRYAAIAYVKMGQGEKPDDLLTAYDASEVVRNLEPLIGEQAS